METEVLLCRSRILCGPKIGTADTRRSCIYAGSFSQSCTDWGGIMSIEGDGSRSSWAFWPGLESGTHCYLLVTPNIHPERCSGKVLQSLVCPCLITQRVIANWASLEERFPFLGKRLQLLNVKSISISVVCRVTPWWAARPLHCTVLECYTANCGSAVPW